MNQGIIPFSTETSPLIIRELIQNMRVGDVMRRNLITADKNDTLRHIKNILKDKQITGVPIVDKRRLIGLISVEDIMQALEEGFIDDPCRLHMSRSLVTLDEEMPLVLAIESFEKYTYRRFPVLNDRCELTGILTGRDVLLSLLRALNDEVAKLEEEIQPQNGDAPERTVKTYTIKKHDFKNAGRASIEIKKYLLDQGVSRPRVRAFSTASYELEMNIVVHSQGGKLMFVISRDRLEVIARDDGPGIADIDQAMTEGYSTASEWIRSMGFGAGMGLPNIKRAADEFAIRNLEGRGTEVRAAIHLTSQGEEKNED